MAGNNAFITERYTDKNLIESILASFYILDYGYIKAVNPDKTVNIIHAKRLKTYNDESLSPTETDDVEVLTVSAGGFAFKFDYKKGDKVLLLGLKDYIPKVKDVTSATETTAYMHYTRETIKALPLDTFSDEAKVVVTIENGKLTIANSSGVAALEVTP